MKEVELVRKQHDTILCDKKDITKLTLSYHKFVSHIARRRQSELRILKEHHKDW